MAGCCVSSRVALVDNVGVSPERWVLTGRSDNNVEAAEACVRSVVQCGGDNPRGEAE